MVNVEELLKALADPTRAAILDELVDRTGQTLFEICNRLASRHRINPSRQAISQHLQVLEAAGLVHSERSGRYKFHYVDTSPLRRIAERWPPAGPEAARPENAQPERKPAAPAPGTEFGTLTTTPTTGTGAPRAGTSSSKGNAS
ncbi:helix-turn-helix domain-containing protein [Paeniglutamicibacter sp. ZC-3]|uniref:ArsR/SmtB family transcription factor n=1 Tax=Paeniglutamicibacter sp. ZC-3 TaxID=2986919 RepID=UPI0021F6A2BB|nr:metalloregulator ArsR/SmtB family transcription factor [Paeniglutamicibacter sp. ZC-3]MCV9992861.1 helix-turn-helix domain-containing protein [Paeniglutamicibacter sp. ZC-3]